MERGINVRYGGLPDTHGLLKDYGGPGATSPPAETLPISTHERRRLLSARTTLVTDLGGGARRIALELLSGATSLFTIWARLTQPAATSRTYQFGPNLRDSAVFIQNENSIAIPENLRIPAGFTLRLTVTGAAPTDSLDNTTWWTENWIDG